MERHGRCYLVVNNGYFVAMAILCLEMAASWDVYGRGDLAAWSACSIVASIVNIYSLSSRHFTKHNTIKYNNYAKKTRLFFPGIRIRRSLVEE